MTTPVLPLNSDDIENTFVRDNSRKKSYAEALQEDNMQDSPLEAGNRETEDQLYHDSNTEERGRDIAGHQVEAQVGQPVANEHHHKTYGMTIRLSGSSNQVNGYLAPYR